MLLHEEDDQMEHSQYRHFSSRAHEGVDVVVGPVGDRDHVGCLSDQVKLTHALNEELDQAMKYICQFGDQGGESSRRITEFESLYKRHEKDIEKLKQENTSLELGIQSCSELILEIAAETGLDKMGEDGNEHDCEDEDDDNDGGDAAAPPAVAATTDAAPAATAPELDVEEEEDLEMLISEHP
jgi:hypothetical protein